MRVAEILSDLTSLRVCEPSAAIALVSTRSKSENGNAGDVGDGLMPGRGQETDVDLVRAKDLLTLHSTVKLKHSNGVDIVVAGDTYGWTRARGAALLDYVRDLSTKSIQDKNIVEVEDGLLVTTRYHSDTATIRRRIPAAGARKGSQRLRITQSKPTPRKSIPRFS